MANRNAPASFTFEQWRVEFNELGADVGCLLYTSDAADEP